jgi:hypothetical protein
MSLLTFNVTSSTFLNSIMPCLYDILLVLHLNFRGKLLLSS